MNEREKAIKEWKRKKKAGLLGPFAHLTYGVMPRYLERSVQIVRPPLSYLSEDRIEELEARFEEGI